MPVYTPPDIGPGTVDFRKHRYVLGFDTETYRMPEWTNPEKPDKHLTLNRVTRMVCSTWAGRFSDTLPPPIKRAETSGHGLIRRGPKGWSALLDRTASKEMFDWAFDPRNDVLFVVHNSAFDTLVALHECRKNPWTVQGIFQAFADGRIVDTLIREKLIAIAEGWTDFCRITRQKPPKYDLESCVKRRLGHAIAGKKGDDAWRLRYNELDGVPVKDWPPGAVDYALMDAEYALYLALEQCPVDVGDVRTQSHLGPYKTLGGGIVDETRQCRGGLALALQPAWGVRTDPTTVAVWEDEILEAVTEARVGLARIGVLRQAGGVYRAGHKRAGKPYSKTDIGAVDQTYFRTLVAADLTAQGLQVPVTETGLVSLSAETLAQCSTPEIQAWAAAAHFEKWRSTYLQPAKIGTWGILPYNYDVLKETGRTSSFGTNCQNPPKKGRFRSCVVARPGKVLCSTDFTAAELCGLGQIHLWMYGVSVYAEMAAKGIDLHAPIAAQLWGKTLDEFLTIYRDKKHPLYITAKTVYRQLAKALNFGGWGGLGPAKFVKFCLDGEPSVDLYDIAEKVGDRERFEADFRELCENPYDMPPHRWKTMLRWEIGFEDSDKARVLRCTETNIRRYVACAFAEKILRVLRKEAVPEGGWYLDWVGEEVRKGGGNSEDDSEDARPSFTFVQWVAGRQRAKCNYTNGANTGFQGIVADGGKEALWRLCVACYLPPEAAATLLWSTAPYWEEVTSYETLLTLCQALYGVRPVMFIHDEIIAEGPEQTAHLWAPAMAAIMRDAMRTFIRDVKVGADPALMYVWDKLADPVYDADGRLIVWKPEEKS